MRRLEVVSRQDGVVDLGFHDGVDAFGHVAVRADADEACLARLLGLLQGLHGIGIKDGSPTAGAMYQQQVHVIGLESLEACLEGAEHAGGRARRDLGADVRFVSLALEHPPHRLLARLSRHLVAVGRVEPVDAHLERLDDHRLRRNHAADRDGGHLQSRPSKGAVLKFRCVVRARFLSHKGARRDDSDRGGRSSTLQEISSRPFSSAHSIPPASRAQDSP